MNSVCEPSRYNGITEGAGGSDCGEKAMVLFHTHEWNGWETISYCVKLTFVMFDWRVTLCARDPPQIYEES